MNNSYRINALEAKVKYLEDKVEELINLTSEARCKFVCEHEFEYCNELGVSKYICTKCGTVTQW